MWVMQERTFMSSASLTESLTVRPGHSFDLQAVVYVTVLCRPLHLALTHISFKSERAKKCGFKMFQFGRLDAGGYDITTREVRVISNKDVEYSFLGAEI